MVLGLSRRFWLYNYRCLKLIMLVTCLHVVLITCALRPPITVRPSGVNKTQLRSLLVWSRLRSVAAMVVPIFGGFGRIVQVWHRSLRRMGLGSRHRRIVRRRAVVQGPPDEGPFGVGKLFARQVVLAELGGRKLFFERRRGDSWSVRRALVAGDVCRLEVGVAVTEHGLGRSVSVVSMAQTTVVGVADLRNTGRRRRRWISLSMAISGLARDQGH